MYRKVCQPVVFADVFVNCIDITNVVECLAHFLKSRHILLTSEYSSDIILNNLINQTVEAEITATMPSQRARGAESRVRNKLSNGPRRVHAKAGMFS